MIKNTLYSDAMSVAIAHVVKESNSDHIRSVHWSERGVTKHRNLFGTKFDYEYVDILVETTDGEGEAHEEWEIRVTFYENERFRFPVISPKYVTRKLLK